MGGQVEQQMFTLPELLATLLRSRRRHVRIQSFAESVCCRRRFYQQTVTVARRISLPLSVLMAFYAQPAPRY